MARSLCFFIHSSNCAMLAFCVTLALGYYNVVSIFPSHSRSFFSVFLHSKLYIYHHFNRKTTTEAGAIIIFMYTHIISLFFGIWNERQINSK